jgi:hypothetical protein
MGPNSPTDKKMSAVKRTVSEKIKTRPHSFAFHFFTRPELHDQYQIKTSFPNMVYDDVTQTLDQVGLVPNATLHILVRT